MQCPKCDFRLSPEATECEHCGVILAKAAPAPPRRSARFQQQAAAPPARNSSVSVSHVVRIVVIVAALWYGWRFYSGKSAAAQPWYQGADGFDRALVEQKSNGKPILLYFHTEWCGYCKRLEHDVLSTGKFGQQSGSILKVKVNPETGSAERDLAHRYAIRGFPTLFIIAAGKANEPMVGYGSPDHFYSWLQQAVGN